MSEQSITKRFAISAALHIAAGAALYAWRVLGVEQAGNVFIFWMWFVAILFSFSFLASFDLPKKRLRKNRLLTWMNLSAWLFFVGTLVWIGYVFLPSVLAFGLIAAHILQSKYDKDGNLKAEGGDV
ncbi:hypothetical protein [Castellaniella sp.]|uniref:hypothetical protein n=1 Tax=Castellaniella sp. TaxID=1955812 RepID=UPI002AFFCB34|nr:hypothetical protein [Castellaniella sp.]